MKILGKTDDGNLIVEMSQQEWDEPDKRLRSGWTPPDRSLKSLGLPKRIENIIQAYLPALFHDLDPDISSIDAIHYLMQQLTPQDFVSRFRQFGRTSYWILQQRMIQAGYTDLKNKMEGDFLDRQFTAALKKGRLK